MKVLLTFLIILFIGPVSTRIYAHGNGMDLNKDFATLNFYRTNSMAEHKSPMEIYINEKHIVSIKKGSRFSYKIKSDQKISIYATGKRCETQNIMLEVKAGETYYIKVDGITCFIKSFDQDIGIRGFNNKYDFDGKIIYAEDESLKVLIPENSIAEKERGAINIQFISPQYSQGQTIYVNNKLITIKGEIEGGSELQLNINDKDVYVTKEGYFEESLSLNPGANQVKVKARDQHGNVLETHMNIMNTARDYPGNKLISSENEVLYEVGIYYALIIGINNYDDPSITFLDNPVNDSRRLKEVLNKKYLFEEENIILLEDPTRGEIIEAMDGLRRKISNKDNLLIFYAGHGYWSESDELGYWLPSDARASSTANWMRNTTTQSYIGSIDSRHTLLIADACFSGGIFKTRKAFLDASKGIIKLHELPSRKAMTSGTLKEVPDKSVFIDYLIKRLESNSKKYISSEYLFASFREAVLNNSPNIPQYGVIQNAGDEGGDFIFIRREE